jgi:predicted RNA binding protein YcfA (HicA-like mRNA interferase family)
MARLRNLSGTNVVEILALFGFIRITQRGSHVKLRRVLEDGARQTLTVPLHPEIDKGTLEAIYRQASAYISRTELEAHFFSS